MADDATASTVECPAVWYPDHPPVAGARHPWLDPLAPQDPFDPRPDAELALIGSLVPPPESFPFTSAGRRDFYEAVRKVARQLELEHRIAQETAERRAREEALARQRSAFLLLLA